MSADDLLSLIALATLAVWLVATWRWRRRLGEEYLGPHVGRLLWLLVLAGVVGQLARSFLADGASEVLIGIVRGFYLIVGLSLAIQGPQGGTDD